MSGPKIGVLPRLRGVVVAVCLACSFPVWSWGPVVHRVTGYIATDLFTPKTREKVLSIVQSRDLSAAVNYLDFHREELEELHPGMSQWHFIDLPVCLALTQRDFSQYCPQDHCLSVQYAKAVSLLKNAHASPEDRLFAVRVIVHLIGDATQPLHVSTHNDVGGNLIRISPRVRNLHYAWDSYIVRYAIHGFSEPDFAKYLLNRYKDQLATMAQGDMPNWIMESFQYAKTVAYGMLPGFSCSKSYLQTTLTHQYLVAADQVLLHQITAAGVRIAAVLNKIFDPGHVDAVGLPVQGPSVRSHTIGY